MSRSLSSQITTGVRRALRTAAGTGTRTAAPMDARVLRPRRWAAVTAAAAVVVMLATQPAEAFVAAHAGSTGSPVTPQQISESLDHLGHRVSAADTAARGGAGRGKRAGKGVGELSALPGPTGPGTAHLSAGGPAPQTGSHTQPPADLRSRQLNAGKSTSRSTAKAAPDATSATGIPGPTISGSEITSLRTATTSVFQNADGTRTMRVYSRPVHFRKSDGTWGNIDTRLVQDAAGRWGAKANDPGISFADSATDPALVSWSVDSGHQASYSLQGVNAVAAKVTGNTITYPGAWPSTDVVYDALATSIKETLVLRDASAPNNFTFPLNTTGLTAALDKSGDVVFTDSAGQVDLVIPRGFMRDSAHHGDGQVSAGVTYQLVTTGGQQALQVSLDAAWLHDPTRVFPVRVDPSTSSANNTAPTSTFVETPYNTNFSTDPSLKVGTYDSGGHQATSYILFNTIGTSSLQNDYIEKVTLNVDAIDGSQCHTPTEVDVHQITGSWSPSTVTLASQVPLGSKIGYDTFAESNQSGCTSGAQWVPFDLGDSASATGVQMVENWVHGGSNYGVALTADLNNTDAWKVFNSTSSSYPPYLSVTYSAYGAEYSTPASYTPPTTTSTGSQSVTLTNRGNSTWATTMKLKARLFDAGWNEISTSAPLTAIPSSVAPNSSVTMTGTIPALAPGKSYQLCWDLYVNGTDSLYTTYGVPFQNCTWIAAGNIPPQIDAMEPLSNATITSLSPELFATGHDPDNWPGTGLTYDFQLLSSTGSVLASSGWRSSRNWIVPRGLLAWNGSYAWMAAVSDGKGQSAWSSPASFVTQIPQPAITSHLAQGSGRGRPFDPNVGNYTTASTDAKVSVPGPALAITRSYNSLDPRTGGLFGAGWSSLYDMQVQPDANTAGGVLVTNASGRVERFGRNDFALASATSVGDATGDGIDDIVAVDDSSGDLYLYPGPDFVAANRIGIAHTWVTNPSGPNPNGNWSTLTNLTGGPVDGGGHGDLLGVDPTTGSLWEFSGTTSYTSTPCTGTRCSAVMVPFQNGPFASSYPKQIGASGWNALSGLTITPPLSGDGKKDLLAVENSTGILWAYPFNSDGTLGSRVEVGTGWTGNRELTGGTFQGSPGFLTIDPSGNLRLYLAQGSGTLGTGIWKPTQYLSSAWANFAGLAAVNGIPGDSGSDFVATDMKAGLQYLYHGATSTLTHSASGLSLYTSPQGQAQQLYRNADGTWVLRDNTGTTYTFAQVVGTAWKLTSIKDKQGRTQTLSYASDGTLSTITDTASNRHLNLAWNSTKTHVTSVTTDAVSNTSPALTWNYTYDTAAADQLDQVCAPATGTNTAASCTGYNYTNGTGSGSHYRTTVLDAEPRSYWRLDDAAQSQLVSDEVLANESSKSGVPSGVDLGESPGTPQVLPGSPTTVAGFNGTSSQISLPDDIIKTSYLAVGLWFKTSTKGGVLFSYQADDLIKGTTTNAYTPALYIGSSGKLYGQFYGTGATVAPMSTSASVADGNWHFAVLTSSGNTQELWLDGTQAATLTAQVQPTVEPKTYLGAGYLGGSWPDQPHPNSSTGYASYFNGQMAEVALYQHALGAPAITGQYQAAKNAATELTGITLPSTKSKLAVVYDSINDRASQITDANGGTWKLHTPTAAGSVQAYRSAVKASNPSGYWTLADGSGTQAANQVYAARPTPNNGTYSNVTLGGAAPWACVTASGPDPNPCASAGFDGATSWAELPSSFAPRQGPGAISLWFKTSGPGVLFSYQSFPVGAAHVSGTDQWNPALYVGADGKLHGEMWTGSASSALASSTTVTDGKWHFAVLDATGVSNQTLYLDGTAAGTLSGTISAHGTAHVIIGAGATDTWPSPLTDPDGHFSGQIADVATFPMALTSAQITAMNSILATDTKSVQDLYDADVLGAHPTGYWKLADTTGNIAAEQVSTTVAQDNRGTYNGTTCCQTGPWASGTTPATGFNGTSSYVQLPGTSEPTQAPAGIELWFNTSSPGVLYAYQSFPLGATHTSGTDSWNPALYVGTDGKLYGELWNGTPTPAVSATTVNDGKWHMAALTADGTTQQLYLDGQPTGSTISGALKNYGQGYAYLGAGTDDGSWPNHPTDTSGHLNGSLADFTTYNHALAAATVLGDFQAATTAANGTGMMADEAYRARVVSDDPIDYWRLADPTGSSYAQDELGTALPDPYAGTYTHTTLGVTAPSGTSDTTAASFDGSTSSVQLPATAAPITGTASIELWFRTSGTGVLYAYQTNQLGTATTSTDSWNPALYVGADGRLHGQFWTGSTTSTATSSRTVNDNMWHQAVLTASGGTQQLYLDGQTTGSAINAGPVRFHGDTGIYLGAGTVTGWPSAPTADSTGTNHYTGSIAEASYYPAALTSATVTAHYQAMGNQTAAPSGAGIWDRSLTAGSWIPATQIDANGAITAVASAALTSSTKITPDGSMHVESVVPGSGVWDRIRDAGGNWSIATQIDNNGAATAVAAAALTDGTLHVETLIPGSGVYDRTRSTSGTWSSATLIDNTGSISAISAAALTDGTLHVDDLVPGYGVYDRTLSGSTWTATTHIDTNGSISAIASAALTGGSMHVDTVVPNYGVYDRALTSGTWQGSASYIDSNGAITSVSTAGLADGSMHVDDLVPGYGVYDRTLSGSTWTATTHIDTNGNTTHTYTAGLSDGSMHVGSLGSVSQLSGQSASTPPSPTPVITATLTDPGNNTLAYRYNVTGQETASVDAYGDTTTYGYDTGGFLQAVTDADGHTATYGHDARGNAVSTTTCRSAGNCQTRYATYYLNATNALDPQNDAVLTTSDARSASSTDTTYTTRYTYDGLGDRTNTQRPDGSNSPSTYTAGTETAVGGGTEPPGLLSTSTDFNQNKTSYYYTSSGNLDHTVSPSGLTTSYTYDGLGRLASQTVTCTDCSIQNTTTSYTWDGQGNLLTRTDPIITDPVNGTITHQRVTTNAYDPDGDRTSQTVSDATGTDKARTTTWAHTNTTNDLVTSTTDPAGHTTSYGYDAYGNLTSKTDANGTNYSYSYSPMGQLQQTAITNFTGNPNNPVAARTQILDSRAYDPAGRLATDTDAMGRTTHTYYYDDNRVSEVDLDSFHDFNPQTKTFTGTTRNIVEQTDTYDPAGNLTQRTTGGGKTTVTSAYDSDGRVTNSTLDPAGLNRTTSYIYDADNHVLTAKIIGGGQTREADSTYDVLGDTTKTTVVNSPANSVTTYTYDQAGELVSSVSPNGNATGATPANYTTTYTYDALGEPTQTITPPVSNTTFSTGTGTANTGTASAITATGYNTFGETADTKDADGNITTITHTIDTAGMHLSVAANSYTAPGATTPVTPVVQTDYDPLGHPARTTVDPTGLNRVTSYKYDQRGNRVEADYPAVNGTTPADSYAYDLDSEVLSATDATGAIAQSTYDDLGRPITLTQIERQTSHTTTGGTPTSYTTGYGYDDAGNKTSTIDPLANTTSATFDAAGEMTSVTDPLGRTTTAVYDLVGDTTKTTQPGPDSTHAGTSATTSFDQAGNPTATAVVDGTGTTVASATTSYDLNGNPTAYATTADDGTTATTTATYDAADQLVQQVQPVSTSHTITTKYAYDAAGNPTAYTDGMGNTTYTTYNTLGLPESQVDPATSAYPNLADRSYTTSYDTLGEPTTVTEPGGVTQTSTYDSEGNLLAKAGTGAEAATTTRSYGYDQIGRLTSLSTPTGTETYTYTDRGQLWSSSGPAGNATFTYDGNGQLATRTDASGTTGFTYDNAGELTALTDPITGASVTYSYYGNGDRKTATYGTGGPTQTYTYNALHQLTGNALATGSGGTIASQAYAYYPSGRVKTQTNTGFTGPSSNTYTYDQAGRLTTWNNGTATTAYAYDDNGNLTQRGTVSATYNQRNQLQTLGTAAYSYTARGTLTSSTINGTATTTSAYDAFDQLASQGPASYTYDGVGRLMSTGGRNFAYDTTSDAISSDGTENYTRDPAGQLTSIGNGTSTAFAYTDPHGDLAGTFTTTGTALVSSTAYDPWGQTLATAGTGHDIGYQGGWTDPTNGQINTASRWYNPATADFTSRDTAPLNPTTSANGNLYAYAADNPVTLADPSGHSPTCDGSGGGNQYNYGGGRQYGYAGRFGGRGYSYDEYGAMQPTGATTALGQEQYQGRYGRTNADGQRTAGEGKTYDGEGGTTGDESVEWQEVRSENAKTFEGDWAAGADCTPLSGPPAPPPPPPIDWHKVHPHACADCRTDQPDHHIGPETGHTHAGQASPSGAMQQQSFSVLGVDPATGLPVGQDQQGRRDPCDTGPRGIGTNIEYMPLETAPGTNQCRATGAFAELSKNDIRSKRVDPSVTPDGYDQLSLEPARGHLIASVYGGAGRLPENFVPMYQSANQLMYNTIEQRIERSLKAGGRVSIWVTPVYGGPNPLIPSEIQVIARGSVNDNCRIVNSLTPASSCKSG